MRNGRFVVFERRRNERTDGRTKRERMQERNEQHYSYLYSPFEFLFPFVTQPVGGFFLFLERKIGVEEKKKEKKTPSSCVLVASSC